MLKTEATINPMLDKSRLIKEVRTNFSSNLSLTIPRKNGIKNVKDPLMIFITSSIKGAEDY